MNAGKAKAMAEWLDYVEYATANGLPVPSWCDWQGGACDVADFN